MALARWGILGEKLECNETEKGEGDVVEMMKEVRNEE